MLPHELEGEVLVKLPIKSLVRFKSVCKRWRSFIQSSSFIKRYNQLSNTKHTGKLICFRKDPLTNNHVVSLYDNEMHEKIEDLEFPPFIDDGLEHNAEGCFTRFKYQRIVHMLGPVNGFYCIFYRLFQHFGGSLILWNPATREHKYIVPPVTFPFPLNDHSFDRKRPENLLIGFGFDHKIHDYKLVVIYHWDEWHGPKEEWLVKVYTPGNDTWRTIYSVENVYGWQPRFEYVDDLPEFCNSLVNGTYHWPCLNNFDIVTFDMTEETFGFFQGPPIPHSEHFARSHCCLRGNLALVASASTQDDIQVWTMEEYGVDSSWVLFYSVQAGPQIALTVLGIPYHERIYLVKGGVQLMSCGLDTDDLQEHDVYGGKIYEIIFRGISLGVLDYVETLSPLRLVDEQEFHS